MTDAQQPISLVMLAVLAWCWLSAIGGTVACLWLLVLSAAGFGSSSPTAAALAGAGLMLALVIGIPLLMLWIALIQQVRRRDRWRGLAVTALFLLAAEALVLPIMNTMAGSGDKPFVVLLGVVGITILAAAVLILVKMPGSASRLP